MSESQEDKIEQLMSEGLNQYAMGEDARAMDCWRQVLELDPQHAEAQDYLRTAGGEPEVQGATSAEAAPAAQSPPSSLLAEATLMLRSGPLEEAFEMLESVTRVEPGNLEAQALLELSRAELLGGYWKRTHAGMAVPQLKVAAQDVARFNLPASAQPVLAAMDGTTSVNELLATSGLDPFDALRICCRLLDADIIEVQA